MVTETLENPFRPGPGVEPPHLAGRQKELKVIKATLEFIKGRSGRMDKAPFPILALVGPRGVGKTVLLERAVDEAKERDIHVGEVTRALLSGPLGQVVWKVLPQGGIKQAVGSITSFNAFIAGTGVGASRVQAEIDFDTAMRTFLTKSPMLLFLDEAHHCEPEGLSMLFDVAQGCMRSKLPLAFLVAGTPGLVQHLRQCKATYAERSKFLRFNILSQEEAREALEVPAKDTGRPLEEDALRFMLDWSDNYPFFIQMVGEHAWNASEARGGNEISIEDVKAGLAEAELLRNEFYEGRYDEIYDLEVVDQAVQIADLVTKGERKLDRGRLAASLAGLNDSMDEKHAVGIVDALLEKGYLWRNQGVIEPGIPSLFDYVKKKACGSLS